MRRTIFGTAVLSAILMSACGGENETLPPPAPPPPPPPVAVAPPPEPAPAPAPEAPKPTLGELEKQNSVAAYAALNAHDAKKFAAGFTPDATVTVFGEVEATGPDAIADEIGKIFTAFPDFKIAPARVLVKGDVVIQEWVMNGTNKGEFMGAKATDKPVGISGANVLWFTPEGLVKREHRYLDGSTLLSQMGASKQPARAIPSLPAQPEVIIAKGTPEEDKALDLAKPFLTSFEKKSEADFLGPLADGVVWMDLAAPKDSTGKDAAKKFFQMYSKAFSDTKMSIDGIWAVGDYVIAESTMSGKNTGPLGPMKATKKDVAMHGMDLMQLKDGKIVKGTSYSNSIEMLGQMGLLPKPKAPPATAKAKADDKGAKPAAEPAKAPVAADAMKAQPKATPAADTKK